MCKKWAKIAAKCQECKNSSATFPNGVAFKSSGMYSVVVVGWVCTWIDCRFFKKLEINRQSATTGPAIKLLQFLLLKSWPFCECARSNDETAGQNWTAKSHLIRLPSDFHIFSAACFYPTQEALLTLGDRYWEPYWESQECDQMVALSWTSSEIYFFPMKQRELGQSAKHMAFLCTFIIWESPG